MNLTRVKIPQVPIPWNNKVGVSVTLHSRAIVYNLVEKDILRSEACKPSCMLHNNCRMSRDCSEP